MIGTLVAVSALVVAVGQCVRNLRRERRVSRRVDIISDEALAVVLKLFNKRDNGDESWKGRRYDRRFIDAIEKALVDHALTAVQIRKLFGYTYSNISDQELKRYFGWDDALRTVVESAEEEAAKPGPPPPTPPPKLPPISDKDFKAFCLELKTGRTNEVTELVNAYPFSFTLVQRAEVLSMIANDGDAARMAARATLRAKMQIHIPDESRREPR